MSSINRLLWGILQVLGKAAHFSMTFPIDQTLISGSLVLAALELRPMVSGQFVSWSGAQPMGPADRLGKFTDSLFAMGKLTNQLKVFVFSELWLVVGGCSQFYDVPFQLWIRSKYSYIQKFKNDERYIFRSIYPMLSIVCLGLWLGRFFFISRKHWVIQQMASRWCATSSRRFSQKGPSRRALTDCPLWSSWPTWGDR